MVRGLRETKMNDWIVDGYHKQLTKGLQAHVWRRPWSKRWRWYIDTKNGETIAATDREEETDYETPEQAAARAEVVCAEIVEPSR